MFVSILTAYFCQLGVVNS